MQKLEQVFERLFVNVLLEQIFKPEYSQFIPDLVECYKQFTQQKKRRTDERPLAVLLEIVLILLRTSSKTLRDTAIQLFGNVCDDLQEEDVQDMMSVFWNDEGIEESEEESEEMEMSVEEEEESEEDEEEEKEEEEDVITVAVIGKPNAGKSSLINRILGEERLIVSDMAGTTRDAVDTRKENEYGKYIFIDTAGIRRQSKVEDRIEKFSVLRAKMAVERARVCLIMIDATEGVTEQDEKIAGLAHEAGKASIFVINKWDAVEKDNDSVKKFTEEVYRHFGYMTYAPLIFVSAKTGLRLEKLYELINYVDAQNAMRVTTGMLNDLLADAVARGQPPSDKGRYLKIYYMVQTSTRPPEFVVFCNSCDLFHFSYQRYLENRLRETFGFKGTPLKLIIRQKGDHAPDA